jgi:hypothetical protein
VLRNALIGGLPNQTVSQDTSQAVVAGRTWSISSVSQNYAELTLLFGLCTVNVQAVFSTIVAQSATLALPQSQVCHHLQTMLTETSNCNPLALTLILFGFRYL